MEFSKCLLGTTSVPSAMLFPVGRCKTVPALQILLVYLGIQEGCMKTTTTTMTVQGNSYKASQD